MPKEERARLEERINADHQYSWNKEKADLLSREINQLEDQRKLEEKRMKHNTMITSVLTVFLLLAGAGALFFEQWFITLICFVVCVVYVLFFLSGRKLAKNEISKKRRD